MSNEPDSSEIQARLAFAKHVACDAGRSTLAYFQQSNFEVERKSDDSPVTIADRKAESLVRDAIVQAYPNDTVLGEEHGVIEGTSGYRWIIDPIDGTRSFICGVPLYGTLLGMQYEGRSLLGVIFIPGLDECVYAARGQGAWYVKGDSEPVAARVSDVGSLGDTVFLYSQLDCFSDRGAIDAYFELERQAYTTRTWGDCYGYVLVATGRAGLMVDAELNLWDAAALLPVIEEAGGRFTDWQGDPRVDGGDAVAANPVLLEQVLNVTRQYPRPQKGTS